jgi:3-methyladenine DNA glycosylase AlkD
MPNRFHSDILRQIEENCGKATRHTFSDAYLGNENTRYPINIPTLRIIGKTWMRSHQDLSVTDLAKLLTDLIQGKSSTEKTMAGIMLGYATGPQRKFDPEIFDHWLDHLTGWAEVDSVCTGDFTITEVPARWTKWKKLLTKLSQDENINKRRASLVFLCSPLSRIQDEAMAKTALQIINRVKGEKAILVTKAISWLLRSMVRHYPKMITLYVDKNNNSLPKIAVRETIVKLKTGRKTKAAVKIKASK